MSRNTMTYKGYTALVEYSAEDACLVGRVVGVGDVIGFHGDSVKAVAREFRVAVDAYVKACEAVGKAPQKPCSGKMLLRIPPELHARIARRAEQDGTSANQWVAHVLESAVDA